MVLPRNAVYLFVVDKGIPALELVPGPLAQDLRQREELVVTVPRDLGQARRVPGRCRREIRVFRLVLFPDRAAEGRTQRGRELIVQAPASFVLFAGGGEREIE